MAELEKIDFEKTTEKLLLSQYNKPNMQSLFRIFTNMVSDEQDIIFELRTRFWLEDAAGEQLDFLGSVWDVARGALSDDAYRAEIYKKVAQTFSGTISEIKTILMVLYNGTYVNYSPEYPAGFRVRTDASIDNTTLESISPAGVRGFHSGRIRHLTPSGFLIDSYGAFIEHIDERKRELMTFADGTTLVDAGGEDVITAGFY